MAQIAVEGLKSVRFVDHVTDYQDLRVNDTGDTWKADSSPKTLEVRETKMRFEIQIF